MFDSNDDRFSGVIFWCMSVADVHAKLRTHRWPIGSPWPAPDQR